MQSVKSIFMLLVVLTWLLCPLPSQSAVPPITLVQFRGANACAGSNCTTGAFATPTTAGSTIVVCGAIGMSSGASNTLTSVTGQGTFTILSGTSVNSGAVTNYTNLSIECAYAVGIPGGVTTAESCNWTNTTVGVGVCVAYELTPGVSAILTSVGGPVTGTAVSAGTVTTTLDGSYAIAIFNINDGVRATYYGSVGAGWTQGYNAGGSAVQLVGTEHQAQAAAGAMTGNSTAIGSGIWIAAVLAVEPAALPGHRLLFD